MRRKPPHRHRVKSHVKKGRPVRSYERGKGHPSEKRRRVVKRRIEKAKGEVKIKGEKRVKTKRLVCNIEPHFTMIPYPRRKEDLTEGGIWTCRKGRKKVVQANVQFELEGRYYPLSGDIPAKSGVIADIDVAETVRGKGYGSEVLRDIEREAKEQGIKRMYATSVLFPAEGFWRKQGFKHTGQRRVWIKKLE